MILALAAALIAPSQATVVATPMPVPTAAVAATDPRLADALRAQAQATPSAAKAVAAGAAAIGLRDGHAAALLADADGETGSLFFATMLGHVPQVADAGVLRCRYHAWTVTVLPTVAGARLCEGMRVLAHLDGASPLVLDKIALDARTDIDDALLFVEDSRLMSPPGGRLAGALLDEDALTALSDGPLADSYVTIAANAIIDQPPIATPAPPATPSPVPLPEMLRHAPVLARVAPPATAVPPAPSSDFGQVAAGASLDMSGRGLGVIYGRVGSAATPVIVDRGDGLPVLLVPETADDRLLLGAVLGVCLSPEGGTYAAPPGLLEVVLTRPR